MKFFVGVTICMLLLGTAVTAQSVIQVPNDPATSSSCFATYMPILTNIASTFHIQYQECITTANAQTANLTRQAQLVQKQLMQKTTTICNEYQACQGDTDVLSFYNCYATVSNQDVSIVYGIATNATAEATSYSQSIEQIQVAQNLCTNATETTYVTDTAATYTLLNQCLQTGSLVGKPNIQPSATATAAGSVVGVALGTPATAAGAAVNAFDVPVDTPTGNVVINFNDKKND